MFSARGRLTRGHKWRRDHVGILSDPDALKELSRILDATTAAGKS